RIGLPSRSSMATPCAFAATSTMLNPAPMRHAEGRSTANDGANAVAVSAPATTRSPTKTGPRLPKREDSQPDAVSSTVAVSETPRIASPSRPLSGPSRCLIAGSRATHAPSTVPNATNATASAICAFRRSLARTERAYLQELGDPLDGRAEPGRLEALRRRSSVRHLREVRLERVRARQGRGGRAARP